MNIQNSSRYREVHARSLADPQGFWGEAAREIDWIEPAKKIFDPAMGLYGRWFAGAVVNTCYNALDRHVAGGRADQVALIHDSPLAGSVTKFTYGEMLHEVKTLAAVMADFGVVKGDRVILYMPMVPEAMIAMLACARIGAVHSRGVRRFCREGTRDPHRGCQAEADLLGQLRARARPHRVSTSRCSTRRSGFQASSRRPASSCSGPSSLANSSPGAITTGPSCAPRPWRRKNPPLACRCSRPIRSISSTPPAPRANPKGVVRDNGGHLVALKWSMFNLYGVRPGEVWWCGSDIGWVVGHSYIIYGPLIHGATSIMYEGKPIGTPDAGAFWRVISQHRAVAFFTAPTAFRAIRKEDPDGKFIRQYDLSKFRTLFLAGERADPPTVEWAEQQLKVPVIDHWWQTETGWCIAGNPVGLGQLPVKHGSPTVPMPGYQVDVVDEAARPLPAGTMGSIVIKLPMPPGCLPTLWEQDERCREAYFTEFPGYYKTSDAGYKDEDGYVFVMGRTDDIINVAGHRLSTGGMEEILASHPDVAECAVLGIKDAIKGEVPCGFLVLKAGVARDHAEIEKEIVALVRDKLGPVAAFKLAITVARLPKTRSGKILRGTIKKIADGETWTMPATIEDPKVLDEIGAALKGRV